MTPEWMAVLKNKIGESKCWKYYVDNVLYELYPKETLMWLSSKGLRNSVGIHEKVYKGLLGKHI